MAYSIINQPSYTLYPSDNLSWSSVYSTDESQSAFVYTFTVQTGATAGSLTNRSVLRVPVNPGSTGASFAPNAILRNYVNTPVAFIGTTGPTASNAGFQTGRVIYGQEYNSNGTIVAATGATGTTFNFWSAVFSYEAWPSYNQNEWIVGPTSVGTNFLTDGPSTKCLIPQDLLYVNIADGTYGELYDQNDIFANWGASGGSTYQPYPEVFQGLHDVGLVPPYSFEIEIFDDQYLVSGNSTNCSGAGTGITGYSNMIYQDFFTPTSSIINVNLISEDVWGTQFPELYLFGCTVPDTTNAAAFEEITQFQPYESPGSYTWYEIVNFTTTKPYYAFGLRFKAITTADACAFIGPFSLPNAYWNVQTPNAVYWSLTQNNVETRYPAYPGKQNWFNVGSAVRGGTGFTVNIENSGGDILSDIITFNADCDVCSGCEKATLTWLNSKGGFDTFQFLCVNNKSISVERTIGQQTLAQNYSVGDRGLYNSSNIGKLRGRLNTNTVLEETVTWLESLFMSPEVYEVLTDGTLYPVVIDNSSYQRWATPNKLMVVEFEYTLANLRSSQIK
jgi:hypothetical protein